MDFPACRDPLFRSIWPGLDPALPQLSAQPDFHWNLQRCVQYREIPSCCSTDLEERALVPAFEAWRWWFGSVLDVFRRLEQRLQSFATPPVEGFDGRYDGSTRSIADLAVLSLRGLRDAAPGCFDAVLEFVAGMLCLACRPDWQHLGFLGGELHGQPPFRVRIPEQENNAVWARCLHFSMLGAEVSEATLGVQPFLVDAAVDDLARFEESMTLFATAASLRQGLYELVALQPLQPPAAAAWAAAGSAAAAAAASFPASVAIPEPLPLVAASAVSIGIGSYSVATEGFHSAFDTHWPRDAQALALARLGSDALPEPSPRVDRAADQEFIPLWMLGMCAFGISVAACMRTVLKRRTRCEVSRNLRHGAERDSESPCTLDRRAAKTSETQGLLAHAEELDSCASPPVARFGDI